MAVLGVAGSSWRSSSSTPTSTARPPTLVVASLFVLWVIMLVEYLVRLVVTPNRRGYLKRRWVEPATVIVPPLQGWHIVGMEKVSLLVREGELRAESILRHHSLFRVLIAVAGTIFLGAWLVLSSRSEPRAATSTTIPMPLWWAIVTVTTVGYGDRYPITEGGRIVAVILMLVGIGLIGVLTATVASVFIKEHTDANREEYKKGHADLGQQLSVISDRLADVERRLGATPAELEAVQCGRRGRSERAAEPGPDVVGSAGRDVGVT